MANQEQTDLMAACIGDDLGTVRRLVEEGADIDFENAEHETALTYAIVWNRFAIVQYLLENGADPEEPRTSPWSPLMYAAQEGNDAIVNVLLEAGANTGRLDNYGRDAAAIAEAAGHLHLATTLRERQPDSR